MEYLKFLFVRTASGLLSTVLFFGLIYYLLGETVVTAVLDGRALAGADVYVDGEKVGVTPYRDRLGFGHFQIRVVPPKARRTAELHYDMELYSVVLGRSFNASFTKLPDDAPFVKLMRADYVPAISQNSVSEKGWLGSYGPVMTFFALLATSLMSTGLLVITRHYPWKEEDLTSKHILAGGLLALGVVPTGMVTAFAVIIALIARPFN